MKSRRDEDEDDAQARVIYLMTIDGKRLVGEFPRWREPRGTGDVFKSSKGQ